MSEYIEREAAKDELLSWAVCINHPEHLMREDAMDVLDSIPAADVSPVRHARWGVEVGMNFFKERNGPVCKKRIESNFWNFCPNCGCKMDLEG